MAKPCKGDKFSVSSESLCYTLVLFLLFLQNSPKVRVAAGSIVKYLPGFEGPLPFELETGYIGVYQSEDVQLFYYFIKSESNPLVDPLVLWLTGGPGCSSLFGLLYEIGPMKFEAVEDNGNFPRLVLNPNSGTEVANFIFLDLPVGTGFSYARTPTALQSTDLQACDQVYQFLRKFLANHPEFTSNPFYIGGDSYAGLPIPMIAQLISKWNENGMKPSINLKGYILGNPLTRPVDNNYVVPFAHGMGLISDELYQSLNRNCQGEYRHIDSNNSLCNHDMQAFNQMVANIKWAYILEPNCGAFEGKSRNIFSERRSLDEKFGELDEHHPLLAFKCRRDGYRLFEYWCNDDSVQEALHIHKGSTGLWVRCNRSLPYTVTVWDNISYHAHLSQKDYRSIIYSGDHDMLVPFLATQAWVKSLNYFIVDDWRPWNVEDQVAGYTRSYANQMTFATVKGGGHTAPEYKPLECKAMFKRWISNEPL